MSLIHSCVVKPLCNTLGVLGLSSTATFIFNESLPVGPVRSRFDIELSHIGFRRWRVDIKNIGFAEFDNYMEAGELFDLIVSARERYNLELNLGFVVAACQK